MKRNTITLRDLAERAKELRVERSELKGKPLSEWANEHWGELKELESVIEECSGGDGLDTMLIHEDYFTDYVKELCEDIGDVPRDFPWYIVIDWEATARHIKMDYFSVKYEGETYYYRSY